MDYFAFIRIRQTNVNIAITKAAKTSKQAWDHLCSFF